MKSMRYLAAVKLFGLFLAALPASAEPVRSVHDGDTLTLASGARVRLHGIDAPELRQRCGPSIPTQFAEMRKLDKPGASAGPRTWSCGTLAAEHLRKLVAGRDVDCRERDRDRYGRSVAVCRVVCKKCKEPIDLAREMVRAGLAVAYRRYSLDYAADEDEARRERRGMWGGSFVMPEEWRRR